eukprot:GHVS01058958.1.p1 GENE.GHVS01058958.1~~GHVS01058958.1.p1  ORF type:complete len:351 (+),score=34.32 GHVS01058958.1:149-1201(+)
MVLAYDTTTDGNPITSEDLGVAGAATALLRDALMPNLMQTLEGTPVLVHAGPFANIAHGNSSILADKMALSLVGESGYVITEAGFGADLGFEKMCNIKCRYSGLTPDLMVLVVTTRALRHHGSLTAAESKDNDLSSEIIASEEIRKGCGNMQVHIKNSLKVGVDVVVAVNLMDEDKQPDIDIIRSEALSVGATAVEVCSHFRDGGAGAVALGKRVMEVCSKTRTKPFSFLYPLELSLKDKMECICRDVYGAVGVSYSDRAEAQLHKFEAQGFGHLPVCMAKTQYSLSHDPTQKGVPEGFVVPILDARVSAGAGFVYALLGPIVTMPGLPVCPAYLNIDINTETGAIIGLS